MPFIVKKARNRARTGWQSVQGAKPLPHVARRYTIMRMTEQTPPRRDLPPREEMPGRAPAPQGKAQAAQSQQ